MARIVVTTVIQAATSTALLDPAAVSAELQAAPTDDAFVATLVRRASAAIARYCGRVFAVETVRDVIRQRGGWDFAIADAGPAPLQLARWPVVEVQTILADGGTLDPATDVVLDAAPGWLYRGAPDGMLRDWGEGAVTVTYRAGFATTPPEIEDAAMRLVKTRFAARNRDPMLRSEEIPGVRSAAWWVSPDAGNLPPDVAEALDAFRVPTVL